MAKKQFTSNSKINKLIKRKLAGEKLTNEEFLQLHFYMIDNDKYYCKSVEMQMSKDLKKYISK